MRWTSGAKASLALALAIFLIGAGVGEAAQSTAEASSTASPAPRALAVEQAVADGLAADPGLLSATLDARAAKFREADARFRMLPSLAVSAGYTQLSTEPSPSPSATGNAVVDGVVNALLADFSSTPTTEKDVRADLQYPIFAGFRLHEAAEIAKYQALGKDAAAELNRNALAFEIRRAYWETVRAQSNVEAMRKALELESLMKKEIADLSAQGMANEADSLEAEARYDQVELALDQTLSGKDIAFLMLSSLIGDRSASQGDGKTEYALTSEPGSIPPADALKAAEDGGDTALVARALANRPETRVASIALSAQAAARLAARGDLYPTLSLTGSLAYADPDPRIFPAEDIFNLSWSLGLRLRYDLGGVPGALERSAAADTDLEKATADLARQRNAIALDARKCALALKQARNSLELTKGMVAQAEEGARVAEQKYEVGMAKHSEVFQSQLALVRAQLAVKGKLIDVEIAQADLSRALGLK